MSDPKPMIVLKTKEEIILEKIRRSKKIYRSTKTENDKLQEIKTRLLSRRVIIINGCWIYTGYLNENDYGCISYLNKVWLVPRLSMFLFKPEEFKLSLDVLHTCDTPRCFNPAHLYSGDQSDNMQDAVRRGHHKNANVTCCPKGHEYSEENTYIIPKTGSRDCKICARERSRTWKLFNR